MNILNHLPISFDDLTFYTVNILVSIASVSVPYLEDVKEILLIIVSVSVLIYNAVKIKNEMRKGKREAEEAKKNLPPASH
jgi:DNA topoisomerase VI subunit B